MDKKPLAAIIMASKKEPDGDESENLSVDESPAKMSFDANVDELFSAIKSGDKDSFKKALRNAIETCEDSE